MKKLASLTGLLVSLNCFSQKQDTSYYDYEYQGDNTPHYSIKTEKGDTTVKNFYSFDGKLLRSDTLGVIRDNTYYVLPYREGLPKR